MPKLTYNPLSLKNPNIDTFSLRFVPANSYVLELGCASGYLGEVMRQKLGCLVIGVEIDSFAAKQAKKKLNKVIEGDIEDPKIFRQIQAQAKYDVIFASAIFEHLIDPQKVIKKLIPLLKKDGLMVVTLPNIAHFSIRLSILMGKFDYQKSGILDATHLHFYTLKTAQELLEKNALQIKEKRFEFFGPKLLSPLFALFPSLFVYQVVFKVVAS